MLVDEEDRAVADPAGGPRPLRVLIPAGPYGTPGVLLRDGRGSVGK
ncbi:hypothetical protein ACFVUY_42340 [Kitasatospora sp. NPDC058063]